MENLNFWKYIENKYGVQVSISDSGYRIRHQDKMFEDGDFHVGASKHNLGVAQDIPKLNQVKLSALLVVHGLIGHMFPEDKKLQELYAATRVVARRRANG